MKGQKSDKFDNYVNVTKKINHLPNRICFPGLCRYFYATHDIPAIKYQKWHGSYYNCNNTNTIPVMSI